MQGVHGRTFLSRPLPPSVARRHRYPVGADRLRHGTPATTGPYAHVRHPQYDGLLLVMIGFLLQWPTIPTLIMFPVLVYVYVRLARGEEREVARRFGDRWTAYAARTPAFWPHLARHRTTTPPVAPTSNRPPAR
ncbi:methyltransferase family protein [Streptomyces sparsogenes]|uniref:methyltransferase family protein n=1 Tax=Streptomyces sparsogenes TaxID=67365 RepID=UPI0034041321